MKHVKTGWLCKLECSTHLWANGVTLVYGAQVSHVLKHMRNVRLWRAYEVLCLHVSVSTGHLGMNSYSKTIFTRIQVSEEDSLSSISAFFPNCNELRLQDGFQIEWASTVKKELFPMERNSTSEAIKSPPMCPWTERKKVLQEFLQIWLIPSSSVKVFHPYFRNANLSFGPYQFPMYCSICLSCRFSWRPSPMTNKFRDMGFLLSMAVNISSDVHPFPFADWNVVRQHWGPDWIVVCSESVSWMLRPGDYSGSLHRNSSKWQFGPQEMTTQASVSSPDVEVIWIPILWASGWQTVLTSRAGPTSAFFHPVLDHWILNNMKTCFFSLHDPVRFPKSILHVITGSSASQQRHILWILLIHRIYGIVHLDPTN